MISHFNNGKIFPQAIDVEEMIIGSLTNMLKNKDTINWVNYLSPDDFYSDINRIIFEAIKILYQQNSICDLFTVTNQLKKTNELDIIGGPFYISQCQSKVPGFNNQLDCHIKILKQKRLQRELIRIGHTYGNKAYDDSNDIFNLFDEMNAEIKELFREIEKDDNIITSKQISKNLFSEFNDEVTINNIFLTGHKRFDDKVGLCRDKMILIAGAAKAGKSRFVASGLVFPVLEKYDNVSVFWVTLEDSAKDVLANYISSKIFIKSKDIKRKQFSTEQYKIIAEYMEKFETFDIEFQEQSAKSDIINTMFQEFCKMRKNRFCILIVDNVLSLSDRNVFKNDPNNMYDFIMNEMLICRQKTKQCLLLIHHYNDAQQAIERKDSAYRPKLKDMKGTETFRRTPNTVLLINNPGKYKDILDEYPDERDILQSTFIVDTGANRDDSDNDNEALIHFWADLDFNIFQEREL